MLAMEHFQCLPQYKDCSDAVFTDQVTMLSAAIIRHTDLETDAIPVNRRVHLAPRSLAVREHLGRSVAHTCLHDYFCILATTCTQLAPLAESLPPPNIGIQDIFTPTSPPSTGGGCECLISLSL
ncbi:unnamed protein product [Protopolystoma xenopodis]|uniref:Uncharacterized protein n=1 Tax=Protopolystoma xenopodis TaxID=117903 RepID=A0A3S5A073_9PLAT|nr:unnamed protein product [Protopolystoma xenopodis]